MIFYVFKINIDKKGEIKMKKLSLFVFYITTIFIFISCQKKDSNPVTPNVKEGIYPQIGKKYYYLAWALDRNNNKSEKLSDFFEMFTQNNYSIDNYNDVYKHISIFSDNPQDTIFNYFRVIDGKDIYLRKDTSFNVSKINQFNVIKNSLSKILQKYAWLPLALFSKTDYEIYDILPLKIYTYYFNGNYIPYTIQIKGQNLGFENLTLTSGNFKTRKMRQISSITYYFPNQPLTVETEQYFYFNDELGWYVKRMRPTVRIPGSNDYFYGYQIEFSSLK